MEISDVYFMGCSSLSQLMGYQIFKIIIGYSPKYTIFPIFSVSLNIGISFACYSIEMIMGCANNNYISGVCVILVVSI